MIYNQTNIRLISFSVVRPVCRNSEVSRRIEDAVHKLKEHESVNRQTRRRLEETGCNMRGLERVHSGLQYRHAYTRTCALHARDIAIPVSVNGEASEILGRSYCNMSRRLLKSARGREKEEWEVAERKEKCFFLPAT